MAPQSREEKEGEYLGMLEEMPCYRCKLRGEGLTDVNSNWRLWKADTQVYKDAANTYPSPKPTTNTTTESEDEDDEDDGDNNVSSSDEEKETWKTTEEEFLAKSERRRKAHIWFRVSIPLREQHLADMGGRDKTSDDVFRRLYERVAPAGSPWTPLPKLQIVPGKGAREIERMRGKTWK